MVPNIYVRAKHTSSRAACLGEIIIIIPVTLARRGCITAAVVVVIVAVVVVMVVVVVIVTVVLVLRRHVGYSVAVVTVFHVSSTEHDVMVCCAMTQVTVADV